MALGKLLIDLGANISSFESDMGRAARVAKKESDRIKKQVDVAMKAVAAASVAAAAGLGALIKKTADTGDSIQKLGLRLGASTEFLSQMRFTTEQTGVQFNTFSTGLQRMTRRLAEAAATGKGEAVPALEALGVSIESIQNLAPEDQFKLLADAMEGVESQGEKVRIAMKLFDTEGVALIQTMQGGSAAINELNSQADRLGQTISQEAADSAALLNDRLNILQTRFTGMAQQIGLGVIPVVSEMVDQFNSTELTDGATKVDAINSALIRLYSGALFVGDAFEFLGTSLGKFAADAIKGFEVVGSSFDVFSKRVQRGGLIIAGVFSDTAEKAQAELGREITRLEEQTAELFDAFANSGLGEDIGKDAERIFGETLKRIDKLNKAAKTSGKEIKNGIEKPLDNASDSANEFNGSVKLTAEQLQKIAETEAAQALTDFKSILQSFETPLETLNRKFIENIESIGKYLILNKDNAEAQEKAAELTQKVSDAYEDQKQAIESALTPYEQLIQNLNTELLLTGKSTDQLRQNEAVRLLMSQGVIKAGEDFEQYGKEIKEVTDLLKQLDDQQSIFGGGINSFSDLLREASNDFSTFFDTISAGFKNMGKDSQSFADGLGSVLDFGEQILGYWDSTSGQDDAGRLLDTISQIASTGALGPVAQAISQVAGFIDQLTGGGLFGTSYEATGSTRNLDIGSGGAGGNLQTIESRKRSLFRGTKRRTITEDLDAQTLEALNTLFENLQVAIQNSAEAVGGVAGDIITGSFSQEFDKDGNLKSQISEVLGRTFEESFEEFSQRITAENILAGISSVFDDVGSIAERWRDDAGKLLDGSQLLLQAGADITSGNGLFDTLGEVATTIEALVKPSESLAEAYQRVQGSTLLFADALDIIGQSLDIARVDFVTLATEITEAAGGLQQAESLWSSYFETFYTEQELFEQSLSNATSLRNASLGDLGLDTDISIESFRELFETALPELSAEAVVEWLRAADAIGVVVDLEADLNAQRESNAQQLAALIADINSEIEDMGLTPFALALKDIRKQFEAQIKTAKALGAGEKELAMIQAFATRQINAAISALENNISDALTDLYGTELDQINQQIALLEQQESQIGNVQAASNNLYESQLRAIQNIQDFTKSLLLNEQLSPLNPQQQLDEAMSQFNDLLGLAQLGDVDALNALPALAQTLLGFGQDVFASSQDYVDIFDFVTSSLNSLGVTASPVDPQQQIIGQNSQMIALLEERNRLEAEFDASERLQAALAIADQISDLVSVTGESFGELADRLGVPVEAFLTDLGVSLDTLTVETASALADTAVLLGVEITDLAESVGISLGELADQNSLINDALEQTISLLPSGIQDTLAPLLGAIETATDPSIREELLNQMVGFIDALPADQRDLLAPYFEQIDPITEAQQQIQHVSAIETSNRVIAEEISSMRTESNADRQETNQTLSSVNGEVSELNSNISRLVDILAVA